MEEEVCTYEEPSCYRGLVELVWLLGAVGRHVNKIEEEVVSVCKEDVFSKKKWGTREEWGLQGSLYR